MTTLMIDELPIKDQIEIEIISSRRDLYNTISKIQDNDITLNLELLDMFKEMITIIDNQIHCQNRINVVETWHIEELRQ